MSEIRMAEPDAITRRWQESNGTNDEALKVGEMPLTGTPFDKEIVSVTQARDTLYVGNSITDSQEAANTVYKQLKEMAESNLEEIKIPLLDSDNPDGAIWTVNTLDWAKKMGFLVVPGYNITTVQENGAYYLLARRITRDQEERTVTAPVESLNTASSDMVISNEPPVIWPDRKQNIDVPSSTEAQAESEIEQNPDVVKKAAFEAAAEKLLEVSVSNFADHRDASDQQALAIRIGESITEMIKRDPSTWTSELSATTDVNRSVDPIVVDSFMRHIAEITNEVVRVERMQIISENQTLCRFSLHVPEERSAEPVISSNEEVVVEPIEFDFTKAMNEIAQQWPDLQELTSRLIQKFKDYEKFRDKPVFRKRILLAWVKNEGKDITDKQREKIESAIELAVQK